MKLLIVNLQNPCDSKYHSPKEIGLWFWGRRLNNYLLLCVENSGQVTELQLPSSEVKEIQDYIDGIFN